MEALLGLALFCLIYLLLGLLVVLAVELILLGFCRVVLFLLGPPTDAADYGYSQQYNTSLPCTPQSNDSASANTIDYNEARKAVESYLKDHPFPNLDPLGNRNVVHSCGKFRLNEYGDLIDEQPLVCSGDSAIKKEG